MRAPMFIKMFDPYREFFTEFHYYGKTKQFDCMFERVLAFLCCHLILGVVLFLLLAMVVNAPSIVSFLVGSIILAIYAVFEYYNQIGD